VWPVLRGTVRAVEHLGHEALVRLDAGTLPTSQARSLLELPTEPLAAGDVTVRVPIEDVPRRGEPLAMAVDPARLMLFDRAGDRIRL
jgi:multiple sugar transport system ATP-binding protein